MRMWYAPTKESKRELSNNPSPSNNPAAVHEIRRPTGVATYCRMITRQFDGGLAGVVAVDEEQPTICMYEGLGEANALCNCKWTGPIVSTSLSLIRRTVSFVSSISLCCYNTS